MDIQNILRELNIQPVNPGVMIGTEAFGSGPAIESISPVDGKIIASLTSATEEDYERVIAAAQAAFVEWRSIPAPKRGEVVRQFGDALREKKDALGALVSYEMGKSLQEGLGEVQEMIDICDFAVGLSRQLYGMTTHSERPEHRMFEQYHPLGVVGIISAFNFPVAVWAWNTALAWICGDSCVWKPSEKSALCSIACQHIWNDVAAANGVPAALSCVVNGYANIGEKISADGRIPLVSATGSTRMGKAVGATVGARLGRALLELGGNNAIIITPDADLDMVVPAAVFGAVGTCGQRCTSTRRLIIHRSIYDQVKNVLANAYKQLSIGNPLDQSNHVGPLTDQDAVQMYLDALQAVEDQGGKFVVKGGKLEGAGPIAKNIGEERTEAIRLQLGLKAGDACFFAAGDPRKFASFAGDARTRVGEDLDLVDRDRFALAWIVDFPFYEWDEDAKKVDFGHNPFTMPRGGLGAL